MSRSYHFTYFDIWARGEVSRILFHLAEQPYTETTVELLSEDWTRRKPATLFGQLPMLEVDGKTICQSNAIARYLAEEFGYNGSSAWEKAEINMIMDCMEDFLDPILAVMECEEEDRKLKLQKKFETEQYDKFLTSLTKMLGNADYFVGNKLSVADIQFAHFMSFPRSIGEMNLTMDKYPELEALKTRVENEPKIKAWIAQRPPTLYG